MHRDALFAYMRRSHRKGQGLARRAGVREHFAPCSGDAACRCATRPRWSPTTRSATPSTRPSATALTTDTGAPLRLFGFLAYFPLFLLFFCNIAAAGERGRLPPPSATVRRRGGGRSRGVWRRSWRRSRRSARRRTAGATDGGPWLTWRPGRSATRCPSSSAAPCLSTTPRWPATRRLAPLSAGRSSPSAP